MDINRSSFEAIPLDILKIIQQYLNSNDYRQLLNTTQTIFHHSKFETVYYNFQISDHVPDCLSGLKKSVRDCSKQISLHITDTNEEVIEECAAITTGIHKFIFVNNNKKYNFWRSSPNMKLFCNIYFVRLEYIEGIDRLSGLIGIKILHVSYSTTLEVIDFIPGLKRLILEGLTSLREISQYSTIPELQIIDCTHLNLQELGNHEKVAIESTIFDLDLLRVMKVLKDVKFLDLSSPFRTITRSLKNLPIFVNLLYLNFGCDDELFDGSYFPNLLFLKLNHAQITSKVLIPLRLKIAEFEYCSFDSLSVLTTVKELSFLCCKRTVFSNVSDLSNTRKLVFSGIENLEDVSSLVGVNDLKIVNCRKVKNINKLGGVHRLQVHNCIGIISLEGLGEGNSDVFLFGQLKIMNFSPLSTIYKVTIHYCDGFVDGKQLANVQHLTICKCKDFKDTSALGKVKSLYLIRCDKITGLVGLENVPHIHLEGCNQLEDISCLGKQQSLIVLDCIQLKGLMQADVGQKYHRIFLGIPLVKIDIKAFSWYSSNGMKNAPHIFDMFDVLVGRSETRLEPN